MHLNCDTRNYLFVKISILELLVAYCRIQLYQLEFFQ